MDFKEICRVCTAKTSGMKSIYESYNFWVHHREIFKVITDCASVQIEKFDGFSEQICPSCLEHLSQAYSFKKICEDSDYKFRNDLIVSDKIEEKYELHDNKIKTENDCDYDQYGLEEVDCIDLSDSPKHQEHSDLIDPQYIENEQSHDENRKNNCDTDRNVVNEEDASTPPSTAFTESTFQNNISNKKKSLETRIRLHKDNTQLKCKGNQRVYSKLRLHKCDICDKKFTTEYYLGVHQTLHLTEEQYPCDICDKRFRTNEYLKKHLRWHMEVRKQNKHVSEKQKSPKQSLVSLVKLHPKQKPYKCKTGDNKFSANTILNLKLQTEYKCNICEKRFSNKSYLSFHSKSHAKDERYKCDVCDEVFLDFFILTEHQRWHVTDRRYKCVFCTKKFFKIADLNAHIRMHPKKKV